MRRTTAWGISPAISCAKADFLKALRKVRCAAVRTAALLPAAFLLVVPSLGPTAVEAPSYLGFDRNDYPGDEALLILRKTFSFAGYWLSPPPGEKTSSWISKREILRSQGFGFALLYAGPNSGELRDNAYTFQKAGEDTQAAAAAALHEGFPPGSIIFLDIEEGGRLPSTYFAYLRIWSSELMHLGFRAGIYCSSIPIDEGEGLQLITCDFIRRKLPAVDLVYWAYNDACPPSPGCVISKKLPALSTSGIPYADVWQFVRSPRAEETAAHCAGYAPNGNCYAAADSARRWHLDLDIASNPDPSSPK